MAVTQGRNFVAPSLDYRTKNELNAIAIESGMYYSSDSITVSSTDELGNAVSVTSNRWTVICISNETVAGLKCFTQIWMDSSKNQSQLFIRYANADATAYTAFSMLMTTDYLKANGVINTLSTPTELYIQNTAPAVKSGVTRIWIDTSN